MNILECGIKQSKLNKFIFMKMDIIYVIYVDDTTLADPDFRTLEEVIEILGTTKLVHLNYVMKVKLVISWVSQLKRLVPRNLLLLKLA